VLFSGTGTRILNFVSLLFMIAKFTRIVSFADPPNHPHSKIPITNKFLSLEVCEFFYVIRSLRKIFKTISIANQIFQYKFHLLFRLIRNSNGLTTIQLLRPSNTEIAHASSSVDELSPINFHFNQLQSPSCISNQQQQQQNSIDDNLTAKDLRKNDNLQLLNQNQ
jgi:hypothetical protein